MFAQYPILIYLCIVFGLCSHIEYKKLSAGGSCRLQTTGAMRCSREREIYVKLR